MVASKAIKEVKQMMIETHVLHLLDFSKVFEVRINASNMGIRGAPRQSIY